VKIKKERKEKRTKKEKKENFKKRQLLKGAMKKNSCYKFLWLET